MELTAKTQAKTDQCVKKFHDKFCNTDLKSEKRKQLLVCIHQKSSIDFTQILILTCDELYNEFLFPAVSWLF